MIKLLKYTCYCVMSMSLTACFNTDFLLNRGKDSFIHDNYRQAFIRLLPVARRGNPDAQYALGYMYFNGKGVTEDKKVGIEWMQKSAMQKNRKAIRALEIIRKTPPSKYQPRGRDIIGNGR